MCAYNPSQFSACLRIPLCLSRASCAWACAYLLEKYHRWHFETDLFFPIRRLFFPLTRSEAKRCMAHAILLCHDIHAKCARVLTMWRMFCMHVCFKCARSHMPPVQVLDRLKTRHVCLIYSLLHVWCHVCMYCRIKLSISMNRRTQLHAHVGSYAEIT